MRAFAFGAITAALVTFSSAASVAQTIQFGPQGVQVGIGRERYYEQDDYRRDNYRRDYYRRSYYGQGNQRRLNCEDLRRACMYKDELGETGGGNCRRYRQYCG